MKIFFKRIWQDEAAQDLTEYALLLILIALACIAAVSNLATPISKIFNSASANLTST